MRTALQQKLRYDHLALQNMSMYGQGLSSFVPGNSQSNVNTLQGYTIQCGGDFWLSKDGDYALFVVDGAKVRVMVDVIFKVAAQVMKNMEEKDAATTKETS